MLSRDAMEIRRKALKFKFPPPPRMSGSGEQEADGECDLRGVRYQKFEGWIQGHSDILGNAPPRKFKVGFQVSTTLANATLLHMTLVMSPPPLKN